MKQTCRHPRLLVIIITVAGILLDQITKLLVVSLMSYEQSIPLIPGLLSLTYIHNDGAAFGMLDDHRWIFLAVSTVTILLIGAYLFMTKSRQPLYLTSLSMILTGGIGNMIDRVGLGYVVDFIDFSPILPFIFNGADSFVCVGAALLFLAILLEPKEEKATPASDEAAPEVADRDA